MCGEAAPTEAVLAGVDRDREHARQRQRHESGALVDQQAIAGGEQQSARNRRPSAHWRHRRCAPPSRPPSGRTTGCSSDRRPDGCRRSAGFAARRRVSGAASATRLTQQVERRRAAIRRRGRTPCQGGARAAERPPLQAAQSMRLQAARPRQRCQQLENRQQRRAGLVLGRDGEAVGPDPPQIRAADSRTRPGVARRC